MRWVMDQGLGEIRLFRIARLTVEVLILGADGDVKVHLDEEVGDESRECRICHLNLGNGSNVVELGCDCKNDLAVAHSNCSERWFKIRGNRICEICNSTAENVNVVTELELMQQPSATNVSTDCIISTTNSGRIHKKLLARTRFLNFLLACMVFAFVVSWLFHFSVPS